ncbi:MAG: lyase repeat-like domain protein [Myxococcaceae bacterium]|nr:lyase repeat-like domain protein [Myxococcaceae bacterium]
MTKVAWKARLRAFFLLVCVLACSAPSPGRADSRTDFLIRMLESSSQFRVRTQAALALGSRPPEAPAVQALSDALRDEHPSVRSASAGALELLKDPSALAALRAARKDRDSSVRSAIEHAIGSLERVGASPASAPPSEPSAGSAFYVAVGTPSVQASLPSAALKSLRDHVVQQVAGLDGVRVAPENEGQAAATSVLRAKKMIGFYLDSSVTKIEQRPDGALRAQVSIIVGTYPGRAMRVMLSGAATLSGGGMSDDAKLQAVEAAFDGALRRLPQAMQAGAARAE